MSPPHFSGIFLDIDDDTIENTLQEPEDDFDSLVTPSKLAILATNPAEAVKLCKKFIKIYVTARKRKQASLGPEEYKTTQSVTSATTVIGYWRDLVAEFNDTLLARKRKEEPHNRSQWSLSVRDGLHVDVKFGPIYEVTSWIKAKAEELNLTREQTFVKKEATAEDIVVVIKTVWLRAADIPCNPVTRVAFHSMVLAGGIVGSRPGMLVNLKYKRVALHLVLDPCTGERRPVVTFTLKQNKQQKNVVRRDQADVMDIPITMQRGPLCIVTLVIARAIADNAFDPPVDSLQTLLSRPKFDNQKRLKIKWRHDILEQPIWPISYNTYWRIWTQTIFVAGKGVLTSALRNYIISQGTSIFERSYQPRQIRENLMPIFDQNAEADTELYNLLRNSSLDRDAQAPIYVTQSDIDEWERTRDDLRICREQGDKVRRGTIIRKLSALLVEDRRQRFFEDANELRTSGVSAMDLMKPQENPSRRKAWYGDTTPLANAVASLVVRNEPLSPNDIALYVEKLVAYQAVTITRQASPPRSDSAGTEFGHPVRKSPEIPSAHLGHLWTARCLLCQNAKPSKDLSALREHYEKVHREVWDEPFSCPSCDEICTIDGWNDWVAHIECYHGLENAPKRRPMVAIKCLLCPESSFQSKQGLSIHTSRCHHSDFQTPLLCPECRRQGDEPPAINNLSEWCSHVALSHGGPDHAPTPPTTLFKCLFCEHEISNEGNHYLRQHSDVFDAPFSCPACSRQGEAHVPLIVDRKDWQLHCIAVHGKTEVVFGQQAHELARCLACDKFFSKVADHFTKSHLHSLPFPCPECEKLGTPGEPIQDRDGWVLHCAVAHSDISAAIASRTASSHSKRKRKREDDSAWERRVKGEQAHHAAGERGDDEDSPRPSRIGGTLGHGVSMLEPPKTVDHGSGQGNETEVNPWDLTDVGN
ncbi:Mitosis inhibitor protein kinase mik1 [Diaporthe amygdali]|uniref:Mitosis inhibitor protein kinase mik1 n=1 Tax=Phomopsis amygdali TaxID=1214568 RepID=UPI0022FE6C18|nr:Mitosis inhibitor protein kinase mik1 [Diaporthe amygdali]KAJ0123520.1 Mitosis inhibitor protein kinase mik1 [Diaporthe amygdali]